MGKNDLIGSAEAASLLGISVSHFHRKVLSGHICPVRKLPGSKGAYVFERKEIDRIAEREVSA